MKTSDLYELVESYWEGVNAYRNCEGDELEVEEYFNDKPWCFEDIDQIAFALHKIGIDPMPLWELHAFMVHETYLRHDPETGRLVGDDLDRLHHLINRGRLVVRLLKHTNRESSCIKENSDGR